MSNQKEINQSEWGNPANWGGPDWMAVYFSKKDTRTWVPKQVRSMGWTLNLAKDAGVCWLFGFFAAYAVFLILIIVVMGFFVTGSPRC